MFTLSMKKLNVYDFCLIALLASVQYAIFVFFSNILYLEMITFTIVLFAVGFERYQCVWASIVFGLLMLCLNGVNFWNMMYVFIYPIYSLIINILKDHLVKHKLVLSFVCGFLSFLTGQLLQLPFMLFSKKVTLIYIIMGLKTSIIQGVLSFLVCWLLFERVNRILEKLRRSK